jgi:two-component system, sensor histidine kinase and response regulator
MTPDVHDLQRQIAELKKLLKEQSKELRKAEARRRRFIDRAGDIAWETDPDGRFTFVSSRFKDLLGYEPREAIGKRPVDFMPPDERKKQLLIFHPFTQVDSSTSRKYGGTGLGLVISKELTTLMGGEISVESELALGTTFTFTVPFSYHVDSALSRGSNFDSSGEKDWESSIQLIGSRVLIVEDNEINMQVAREILESFGLIVEEADNGHKAIEMLKGGAERFDAVLLDIQMPEVDGYTVARVVRTELHLPLLPLIAMTAHVGDAEKSRCIAAGMNDHVPKPIEPRDLMGSLAQWITPLSLSLDQPMSCLPAGTKSILSDKPVRFSETDVDGAVKRLSGNYILFVRLLKDFCLNYGKVTEDIRSALNAGDGEGAKRLTHTLKGASGNLSIGQVYQAAAMLEKVIGTVDEGRVTELLTRLAEALTAVVQIEATLAGEETRANVDGRQTLNQDMADQKELLNGIYTLLAKRNIKARRLFATLKNQIATEKVLTNMKQCEDALNHLEFRSAQEQIATIAQVLGVPYHFREWTRTSVHNHFSGNRKRNCVVAEIGGY